MEMADLLNNVFVCSDKSDRLPALIAGARQLGKEVTVLFVGMAAEAGVAAQGANAVCCFPKKEEVIFEDYAPSFAKAIKGAESALVLLSSSKRCKAVAARLGVMLEAAVANDVDSIVVEGAAVTVTHTIYGGLANGTEKMTSPYTVVTTGGNMFEPGAAASAAAQVKEGEFVAPASPLKRLSSRAKQGSSVDLSKAKCVVGVGRGIAKKEDIALAEGLAQALGGEIGCSRPIAEGEGWMGHERYIGVSGVTLNADVYIAVGVSGQIQHMVGANGVKTIVVINKDKSAPIFKSVDYGIVGDLYKILPALTAKLKG